MDISKLTNNDPVQVWVPFGEDTEVLIQYVSREELRAIYRKSKETAFVKHQKVETVNDGKADILLGRAAVKGWRPRPGKSGFTAKGEEFPYTPENCDLLMTRWTDFALFVNDICTDLNALTDADKERERQD